ncbi:MULTISPECIES: ribose-5-phosphate isomerase [Brachybacterium]|uniref:ribose-5-phosphate isomerase n=1 Tax=Brachybacterium TaxID=43668 RepID=UPI00174A4E6D|nr:ribose-5-phosphate isomerase [Brachybacterium paraconglomeratum]MCT1436202.1 ribose-5-phosphate isomerase [Brachybacterium paraconglomeratum]
MRVHIGTDHAGFELKNRLVAQLEKKGHEVTDHGAHEYDALDDYPPFCTDVGEAVVAQPGSLGIVIGGSGNGEQIAANKVEGVRAALVWNEETARLAREHNDANVISVGARQHSEEELEALIDVFLAEPFSGEERHQRRIDLVARYETTGGYSEDQGAGADAR